LTSNDVIGDTVCYGVLLFIESPPYLKITLFLIMIWMAEFFGVMGKGFHGGVRRHETFLGGKPDRAMRMSILSLLLFFFPHFRSYLGYYILW